MLSEKDFDDLIESANPVMAVVTTVAEGVRAGCVVGFHGQSSVEPRHYCVWLSKANHTYRTALRAEHLAVHLLTRDDMEIATHFGTTTGEDGDKFTTLSVSDGPGGVPLLEALPNRFVGRRRAMLDLGGDHACVELVVELAQRAGAFDALRLRDVVHLQPGHEAEERAVSPER